MATMKMSRKKQYTVIIRGKVQSVGFRGYVEEACERLGIGGMSYNIGIEEVRVFCQADLETVKELAKLLRKYEFAEITQLDLKEGILLPDVHYRSIFGTEKEIFGRLDEGVKILYGIKKDTEGITGIREDTGSIREGITKIGEDTKRIGKVVETNKQVLKALKDISDKL